MILDLRQIFIYLFFFLSPFVDALTGFMLFNGILSEGSLFSPSQVFRLFLTIFAFYFLKSSEILFVVFTTLLFLILEFTSFSFHHNFSGFLLSIVYAYKLIFIVLVFFVLRESVSNHLLLLKYFVIGSFIYAIVLILSILLGIDQATYSEGAFGSKGLFASGNGLSLFLGISSVLAYFYYLQDKCKTNLLYYFVLFIGTALVGTKASIFFIAINLGIFFYFTKYGLYLVILSSALVFFVFFEQIVSLFSVGFEVIIFRYNASSSLGAFLASGRDVYIKDAFQIFKDSDLYLIRSIFGSGLFVSFRDYSNLGLPYDTLESDLFDIFFSYGFFGVLLYGTVILLGIYISFKKSQYLLLISWLALCSYSIIAGHMLFNSMSNIAFLILFLLIIQIPKSSNEEKYSSISLTQ